MPIRKNFCKCTAFLFNNKALLRSDWLYAVKLQRFNLILAIVSLDERAAYINFSKIFCIAFSSSYKTEACFIFRTDFRSRNVLVKNFYLLFKMRETQIPLLFLKWIYFSKNHQAFFTLAGFKPNLSIAFLRKCSTASSTESVNKHKSKSSGDIVFSAFIKSICSIIFL
jgi:hypothetical protein